MQALVVFAIIVNIALTDLVSHQQVTWRDLPNLFVCLVMGYLLWSNARAQKAREAMIAEARGKYKAMTDEWAAEDAAREAKWAAQDAEILDLTREHQVEDRGT